MNKDMFKILQTAVIKNAPTILSVMAALGTITAVAMSSEAAVKAKEEIDKVEDKNPSKADKAVIYAKAYAPTALMTGASLICIFGSNHVNKQRIAGIAGAYIVSETAFSDYRDKVEEIVGKKKTQQIKDELTQKQISENPPNERNTVIPSYYGGPDTLHLWFDKVAQRYFYCNAERIRKAELEANQLLRQCGFVSVNDIYEMLDLPRIKTGDDCGWEYDANDPASSRNREVQISIDGGLTDIDTPCGVMDMEPYPNSSWFGI